MSTRSVNPRPQIHLHVLAMELSTTVEHLVAQLTELRELRLIQYEHIKLPHVRLTLLGYTVT
jgi:hypothetical protein